MAQRSVGLDIVRAVCVTGVVLTHFSPFFLPATGLAGAFRSAVGLGSFGVTGFFLLSSYLLTGILLREIGNKRPNVWGRYWARRALRIWPLYYLAVLVVSIVGLITATRVAGLPWLLTLTYNWVNWSDTNELLGHFWSMCAEEQLYILIPILSFIAFKWRWRILVGLIVIAPISRFLVATHLPYPAVWNFTTSHLDVFALGALLASFDYAKHPRWIAVRAWITRSWWSVAAVVAMALTLGIAAARDLSWVFGSVASTWTYVFAALVWTWLMLKLTQKPQTEVTSATRAPVWLGQRSYGVYVYHWPAVIFGTWLGTKVGIPLPVIGIVLIAAVLAFSEFSFRFIESPFLRLKSRFSRETVPVP